MADPHAPDLDDDEDGVLDLTQVARATRPVITSAGRLTMRRMSGLGPLDRTRVVAQHAQMARVMGELEHEQATMTQQAHAGAKPAGPDGQGAVLSLDAIAARLIAQEDELLRIALVDVTDEQLAKLSAPERAGILSAFFGATPAEAQRVVAGVVAYMEARAIKKSRRRGTKPSPVSSGSTAATPSGG